MSRFDLMDVYAVLLITACICIAVWGLTHMSDKEPKTVSAEIGCKP